VPLTTRRAGVSSQAKETDMPKFVSCALALLTSFLALCAPAHAQLFCAYLAANTTGAITVVGGT
jgi:hypothetical protein